MDRDFSVGGRDFRLSKLDAFKQFHIVRRLGPILGDIIPVASRMGGVKQDGLSEDQKLEQFAEISKPILEGLSKLSEADANTVLLGLLSAVEVKQMPAGNWAKIARDGNMMIEDLDLSVMLQAAGRAFAFNLAGFFATAHQTSHGAR